MDLSPFSRLLALAAVVVASGCRPKPSATTAAAPAGGGGTSTARAESFEPFFFVQAGDPQVGMWGRLEDTRDRLVRLAGIVNQIKPAFVVVPGDIVDAGDDAGQWKAAMEALAAFRVPVKAVPGNHDDIATYRQRLGADHYSFVHRDCLFVCVNSNLMQKVRAGKEGSEAAAQWRWLEETLAAGQRDRRTHVFLVAHHPSHLTLHRLRLEALMRKSGVEVMLSGHNHKTAEYVHRGYVTYTVAGTGWTSDKRGFGYRVFRVYADRVEQEYHTIDQPAPSIDLKGVYEQKEQ